MSRYIHDKTTHELIPVSGFGSRVATSVNGNTLKVHGSLLDIEGYNYGEGDITTAVQMIAPIESTLVASKAYAVGDQFVYEGLLYKATAAIAEGGTITIGTNVSLADSVTEQIKTSYAIIEGTLADTLNTSVNVPYPNGYSVDNSVVGNLMFELAASTWINTFYNGVNYGDVVLFANNISVGVKNNSALGHKFKLIIYKQ